MKGVNHNQNQNETISGHTEHSSIIQMWWTLAYLARKLIEDFHLKSYHVDVATTENHSPPNYFRRPT